MAKVKRRNKSGFETVNVLALTIAHHIHDIYTSFLAALQPEIIQTFGINNILFGLLSIFQRIPTLFNPFIGILAERVRIRYLIIVAPGITAIAMSIMGSVNNYYALAIIVFISGISSAIFHVPTPVMMRHISGNKPGVGMGFYMFGGEFARTVGPIVAIGALELWGFSGMFRLIPAGILSSVILYVRFRKVDLSSNFKKSSESEGRHIQVLNKYLLLLILIAGVTLVRGGIKSFYTYYLVGYLENIGWSNIEAKLGLTVIYIAGTIGSFISGYASDYLGRRTILIISSLMSPVIILVYIYSDMEMSYWLLGVIGLFLLMPTPVFLSIVNTIKSKHVAFLNGVYMTTNFLMSAIAIMFTGFGLDLLNADFTIKIASFAAILAFPIVLLIPIKR